MDFKNKYTKWLMYIFWIWFFVGIPAGVEVAVWIIGLVIMLMMAYILEDHKEKRIIYEKIEQLEQMLLKK